MDWIDLNRSILQAISLLENQALFYNIDIIKDLDPNLPMIQGDSGQLNQVFINFILNAADAMAGKGILRIATRKHNEDTVIIQFTDTGCGIPEENFSKIFDPFFTTKIVGKGTGLGLSTSYGIVERHGGKIDLKSTVGKGTTFTIELPIEKTMPSEHPLFDTIIHRSTP